MTTPTETINTYQIAAKDRIVNVKTTGELSVDELVAIRVLLNHGLVAILPGNIVEVETEPT